MTKSERIERTIGRMQRLNTYQPEFDETIEMYADTWVVYDGLMDEFLKNGSVVAVKDNRGSVKKNPVLSEIENTRKAILMLANALKLTPKSYNIETKPPKKEESPVARMLKK